MHSTPQTIIRSGQSEVELPVVSPGHEQSLPEGQADLAGPRRAADGLPVPPVPLVPDHQMLRPIGGGSYGDVWLARSVMGTFRAVKVVYRNTFESDRPFEREFGGIRKFEPVSRTHDGLMDVLQIGRNDAEGYFYYVMELADDGSHSGLEAEKADESTELREARRSNRLQAQFSTYSPRTLRSEARRCRRLPLGECIQIGLSMTSALEHLHKHGLIHRDIKPSNIIFARGVPKLADIGLMTHVSEAKSFVGTEGFIPPEGPGSAQADLYSLGKVLYEISTGKDRQDFPDLPNDLKDSAERAGLAELNEIVLKACADDLGQRYRSADAMQADLATLQKGRSVKRKHARERRWAFVRKAGVGMAVLALFIFLTSIFKQQLGRERPIKAEALGPYLEGWSRVREGGKENFELATAKLEQALALDPAQPKIYAVLAVAYGSRSFFFDPTNHELESKAEAAADKARLLGPNLPETLFARAFLLVHRPGNKGWQHERAIESLQRLLDLHPKVAQENPSLAADTHYQLSVFYLHIGLLDVALEEGQTAAALEPLHSRVQYLMGLVALHRDEFREAVERFQRVISEGAGLNYADLALAYLKLGLTNEAHATIEEGLSKQPSDPGGQYASVEAMLSARADEFAKAEKAIQLAKERGIGFGHFHHTAYNIGCAYALLHKPEPAVEWLQRAANTGFPCYPAFRDDPTLDIIRSDLQFQKFLAEQKQLSMGYIEFRRQLVAKSRR